MKGWAAKGKAPSAPAAAAPAAPAAADAVSIRAIAQALDAACADLQTKSGAFFDSVMDRFSEGVVFLGLAVRLDSPGPAVFVQWRTGRHGQPFRLFKFRSMRADADRFAGQLIAASGQQSPMFFKVKNDPRVTPFGRILRKYSVDELPQLLNVLRGDMSIVGPRPQVRREVESYDELVSRRLTVKPGLTGLWQVSGRSDLRPEDAVRLDLHYVENWSPIQDLVIMAKTVKTVLSTDGAY